jgi:hypothetical protein
MLDESSAGVTVRLKPDRRQVSLGGYRRHTDRRLPAAMWMRIADAMNRLQEAAATAKVQCARAAVLRERGRELSAHVAKTIAVPPAP